MKGLFSEQTIAFYETFFEKQYYTVLWEGLKWTLGLTAIALMIGVLIGVCIAVIQIIEIQRTKSTMQKLSAFILKILKWITSLYIYVIRGTPSVLQIVFMWNIVFGSSDLPRIWVGGIAFGINSGAYMAELIRAGIQGIDKGQMEAGRSLGFNYIQTMCYIILPQACTQMLPAFVSEFIVLIKETAIIGYIGGIDLMKAQDIIQSRTFNALQPLLIAGVCYLILTGVLTVCMKQIEKKVRTNR